MGVIERKTKLFEQILRLRRAEREHPSNEDIVRVRAELERELGAVVSRSLAARLLGVTHTTVGRWIRAGDIPVILDQAGRSGVPLSALLEYHEGVERERRKGRRLHVLEPAMAEGRRRAERLDPSALVDLDDWGRDPHDRALRRSLAYHRAIARRLRRPMVAEARHRIWQWRSEGRIDPRYAEAWDEVLRQPITAVKAVLSEDSPRANDLRQSSPFAGMLSEPERRKILREVR